MEALYQVENASCPNPQNFYKILYLFHIFRGWIGLHFISHSFWDNEHLTWSNDSKRTLGKSLGLKCFVGSLPILPQADVPAEYNECPTTEASHMLAWYHQCWLKWEKGTGTGYQATIQGPILGLCIWPLGSNWKDHCYLWSVKANWWCPRQPILLDNCYFLFECRLYWSPVGFFPQHWFDYSNSEAEFTNRSLHGLALSDINS